MFCSPESEIHLGENEQRLSHQVEHVINRYLERPEQEPLKIRGERQLF